MVSILWAPKNKRANNALWQVKLDLSTGEIKAKKLGLKINQGLGSEENGELFGGYEVSVMWDELVLEICAPRSLELTAQYHALKRRRVELTLIVLTTIKKKIMGSSTLLPYPLYLFHPTVQVYQGHLKMNWSVSHPPRSK